MDAPQDFRSNRGETVNSKKELFGRFLHAVGQTRTWQKEYFTTKSKRSLQESKRWEAKLDELLAEIKSAQLALFDGGKK